MNKVKDCINIISKVLLPLAIIYFGWTQHNMTLKFNESKTDKEVMLKFIEISWNSLNSNDTIKIKNAIRLLQTIDPKYSIQLLEVLSLDTKRVSFIKNEIKQVTAKAQESIISNLNIEIHYTSPDKESAAKRIKLKLLSETLTEEKNVSLIGKRRSKNMRCTNEIIYSPDNDYQIIRTLQLFINDIFTETTFDLKANNSLKNNEIIINICQ